MPKYKCTIPPNRLIKNIQGPIICNWSGGASSAMACFIVLENFPDDCVFIHMETNIEHPDTYRFLFDFESRFKIKIQRLQSEKFHEPEDVWRRYGQFTYPNGAPCSSGLKRDVGEKFRTSVAGRAQAFGFDASKRERDVGLKICE